MEISFETINFREKEDVVKAVFMKIFSFDIPKQELDAIGIWKIEEGKLLFPDSSEKKVMNKFNRLLNKGFERLTNQLNGKPTRYIHKNSGIPLLGHIGFGIIDRGTNMLEIKPVTSCNIDCMYCSVTEENRPVDFVVEADYLIEEIEKVVQFKDCEVEISISSQGEPTRYPQLTALVKGIRAIKNVGVINVITNALLLTERRVDELIDAGMTHFHVSLNAIDPIIAQKVANAPYNIEHVKKICKYMHKKNALIIVPTWIPNVNDGEMEEIIQFALELDKESPPQVAIQKFLNYKYGKRLDEMSWDTFYDHLKAWEKKYNIKLIVEKEDFNIIHTKELPKPFKKGDIIEAEVIGRGRMKNETMAVAQGRVIALPNIQAEGHIKAKITRSKHNIFYAEVV